MEQIDAIYSETLKCGASKEIKTWGDAGVAAWGAKSIQLYGRNSVSGTYGYFKEHALCKGDFKSSVNEQPGSASVVQAVTTSVNGIGYSGLRLFDFRRQGGAIGQKRQRRLCRTDCRKCTEGRLSLDPLFVRLCEQKPNQPLPPLEREFLKMVLSKEGQEIVIKGGYIPLPAKVVEKYLNELN